MTDLLPSAASVSKREVHRDFRQAIGTFPTGVSVVSTLTPAGYWGMTVSAVMSVSLEPLLVLVSLAETSRLRAAVAEAGVFAISVLSAGQDDVADRFADHNRVSRERGFGGFPFEIAPVTGCPVLTGVISAFDCRIRHVYPAGDHRLVVGEVVWFRRAPEMSPLVFASSEYTALAAEPRIRTL